MEMMPQKIHEGVGAQNSQFDSLLGRFIQRKKGNNVEQHAESRSSSKFL